jgi:tetratricopeptide (TPR) repeat protein
VEASAVTPSGRDQGATTDRQVALGAANVGYMVELSAFGTAEATKREMKRLQEALSDLLSETDLTVERINVGERGIQYQVQAKHFPDRLTANYMCARVRARKRYCQVVTPDSVARAIRVAKTTNTAFTGRSGELPQSMQRDGPSYALAGVQAQNRGVFGKAIEFYSLAIDSDELPREDLARVYNNRGAAYKNMKFYDLAIDDYNTAIRLKKDYARAYYNRGIVYSSKDLLDDAIKDYSTALQLKPDDAAAYNNRGLAYDRAGLPQKAIADFSQAIRLAPGLSYAYFNRGLAYEVTSERHRAIKDFKKSYSLNPNNSTYQAKMKDIGFLQ